MNDRPELVFDSLTFAYKDFHVLRSAFMKVAAGSVCGLIGRNGCGKSTLMKVGAGQLKPTSGLVIINSQRFTSPTRLKRFQLLGYLPQDPMTPKHMRVRHLLRSFRAKGACLPENDPTITSVADKRLSGLSTGERRYLECMLILSLKRPYVLLDEPFTGLAPIAIERLSDTIRRAATEGAGILISDHYQQYVLPIVDTAYAMAYGRCKELNLTADVRTQLEAFQDGRRFP